MLTPLLGSALLAGKSPGIIVGPIARFLGMIYNILFNFIYSFIRSGSLGIAIILFTIFVKLILFPLFFTSQKSTYKMQKLQPELNKIREKYADKKDQASQQRMAYEMQEFQKKNGINLFGGCLPLLIQLPILYALFYIFRSAYLYVDVIGTNYANIAQAIVEIPAQLRMDVFGEYAQKFYDTTKIPIDMSIVSDVVQVVNSIGIKDWNSIIQSLGSNASNITPLIELKNEIELFMGISLITSPGLSFPGIIVPLLSGFSTWVSSKIMMRNQSNNDPATANMTRSMNLVMPVMMCFMTINVPAGLGIYWTVSNIIQLVQSVAVQKYFRYKDKTGETLVK